MVFLSCFCTFAVATVGEGLVFADAVVLRANTEFFAGLIEAGLVIEAVEWVPLCIGIATVTDDTNGQTTKEAVAT